VGVHCVSVQNLLYCHDGLFYQRIFMESFRVWLPYNQIQLTSVDTSWLHISNPPGEVEPIYFTFSVKAKIKLCSNSQLKK